MSNYSDYIEADDIYVLTEDIYYSVMDQLDWANLFLIHQTVGDILHKLNIDQSSFFEIASSWQL